MARVADYEHSMNAQQFRQHAHDVIDFICDYYKDVEGRAVLPAVQPNYLRDLLPTEAPEQPQPFNVVMQDVKDKIMPGITHWQSPNFFAYYPANSSYPGILGEMLSAAFNTIGFSWRGAPAGTDLEVVVLDWFAKLLGLPTAFLASQPDGSRGKGGGVIQGTASEALIVTMLAAKARALEGRPAEDVLRLVAYSSDQAHSCVKKASMVAGINHCRLLQASGKFDWALQPEVLEAAIQEDLESGLLPFFFSATIGTTSSAAVDPVRRLGLVTRQHRLWMHVDAAYAGVTAILPEMASHFDGLELADSFDTNPHKWLLTNFDMSTLYVQDATFLKLALTLNPCFIQHQTNEYDYKDWQIPFGRRFRALKLWIVLRTYGVSGLRSYLRHHLSLAANFAARIKKDERFQLAAKPHFSLVCFCLKEGGREQNAALLDAVNASGKAFITHTELGGLYVLRLAIGAASTQQRHVDGVWELLCTEADKLLHATANEQ